MKPKTRELGTRNIPSHNGWYALYFLVFEISSVFGSEAPPVWLLPTGPRLASKSGLVLPLLFFRLLLLLFCHRAFIAAPTWT